MLYISSSQPFARRDASNVTTKKKVVSCDIVCDSVVTRRTYVVAFLFWHLSFRNGQTRVVSPFKKLFFPVKIRNQSGRAGTKFKSSI